MQSERADSQDTEKCECTGCMCSKTSSPCWKLIDPDWQMDKLPEGLKSTLILFNLLPPSAADLAKLIIRNTGELYCRYPPCLSAPQSCWEPL